MESLQYENSYKYKLTHPDQCGFGYRMENSVEIFFQPFKDPDIKENFQFEYCKFIQQA